MKLENLSNKELINIDAGGIITGPLVNTEILQGMVSSALNSASFAVGLLGGFYDGLMDGVEHECEE